MATFGVSLSSDSSGPVVAGSKVSGFVWAEVKKELSGRSLEARMFGEERCKVRYYETDYSSDDRNRRRTEYARATRPILQVDIPVNQQELLVNGKVPPGKYELPFEIELPESLPSSMAARGDGGDCSIRYYIKVQLKGSGWFSDYKAIRDVTLVSKPLPKDPVPCIKEPTTEAVNFCCCFNQGTISFGAQVDNTKLGRGEDVRISMSCINDTRSAVDCIKATLVERVRWTAHNRSNHCERTLSKVDFGKFAGLDQKTKTQINMRKAGGDYARENYERIFQDIQSGSHVGVISNPPTANDTFSGRIIRSYHLIIIDVSTGCCVDNPRVEIPVESGTPSSVAGSSTPAPGSTPEPEQEIVSPPANFSDGATVVSPVFVPGTAAAVGGITIETEGSGEPETSFSLPMVGPKPPSLPNLMQELQDSVRDLDIVDEKINDPEWKPVFVNLKPSDYAAIIKKVDLDFDQPKVAELIAPVIKDGQFTCDYLIAAVRGASEWNRINIVEKLLPYCVDLESQQSTIMAELTDWEKTVTAQAFKKNLNKGKS